MVDRALAVRQFAPALA